MRRGTHLTLAAKGNARSKKRWGESNVGGLELYYQSLRYGTTSFLRKPFCFGKTHFLCHHCRICGMFLYNIKTLSGMYESLRAPCLWSEWKGWMYIHSLHACLFRFVFQYTILDSRRFYVFLYLNICILLLFVWVFLSFFLGKEWSQKCFQIKLHGLHYLSLNVTIGKYRKNILSRERGTELS